MGMRPILFREDTRFIKEIRMNDYHPDTVSVTSIKDSARSTIFFDPK